MKVLWFVAVVFTLGGCTFTGPRPPVDLTVMTYNVYIGADIAGILTVRDPALLPKELDKMYQSIVASDVAGRVAAIVKSVKETRPHLIGLQEVARIRYGATTVNFRDLVMGALKAADLDYKVAAEVENANIDLGSAALTDFDLILARSDVAVTRVKKATYTAFLPLKLAVGDWKLLRGYVAIDATVAGATYRVVNTHLEATLEGVPQEQKQATQAIRVSQAQELVASLRAETLPVILLGDFNTLAPDGAAYRVLLNAGYADAWQRDSAGTGNTCCQDANLKNRESKLNQRIDQIFIKGVSLREGAAIRTATVGDKPENKTPGGLWPSDHAGVVAYLPVAK